MKTGNCYLKKFPEEVYALEFECFAGKPLHDVNCSVTWCEFWREEQTCERVPGLPYGDDGTLFLLAD